VCVDFVLLELELGLTFCRMASRSRSEPDYRRRRGSAFAAYHAALENVGALNLNKKERKLFDQKERELVQMLEELRKP